MLTLRTELTKSLHHRGVLADDLRVAAAWRGRLVGLSPWVLEPFADGPVAVLGVSSEGGYLLSRLGVLRFDLSAVRGPHSPHYGHLRFAIAAPDGARRDVHLVIRDADAIARSLRDASERGVFEPRRPPKRR